MHVYTKINSIIWQRHDGKLVYKFRIDNAIKQKLITVVKRTRSSITVKVVDFDIRLG